MKRTLLAAALAALVSGAIAALATVVVPNPQTCQVPGTCLDLATVAAGVPGIAVSYATGPITAAPAVGGFMQLPRSVTFDNVSAGALATFTCSVNPQVNLVNCGASTTCASPTTIASATVTAASTVASGNATAANALVPAGNWVAFTVSPGTCTVLNLQATAVGH